MNKNARRTGAALMAAGVMLIVAALILVGYNVWESNKAGEASEQALMNLDALILERQMENQSGGESGLDALLNMPDDAQ